MDGDPLISARPSIVAAIVLQLRPGDDFLLCGILTKDWLPAMVEMLKDHPEQRLAHLQLGLWKVLSGSVWTRQTLSYMAS